MLEILSWATALYEGPDSNYVWLVGHADSRNYLTPSHSTKAAKKHEKEYGCVPIKRCLWTLRFDFHVVFTRHEIIFFFFFFPQPLIKCWVGPSSGSVLGSAPSSS